MSKINTGFINADYPVLGVVNTTQQFRDNWQTIKTNLETAKVEIQELQDKALVKSPLGNVTFDNNMAGTLISNALVSGFRHTTKNLGNNISGTLTINVADADVQYATLSGPVTLAFTGWPTATGNQVSVQSNCQVIFKFSGNNRQIYFPSTVQYGLTTLPGYSGNGIAGYVSFPTTENQIHYNFSTTTSGATIEVQPLDSPRISPNISNGSVTSVGVSVAGVGFSVSGSPVTTYGNITIQNTGVTQLTAGSNIGISATTGAVTVTNTSSVPRMPMGTPSPKGSVGDFPGKTFVGSQYIYVCVAAYDGVTNIWKRAALT